MKLLAMSVLGLSLAASTSFATEKKMKKGELEAKAAAAKTKEACEVLTGFTWDAAASKCHKADVKAAVHGKAGEAKDAVKSAPAAEAVKTEAPAAQAEKAVAEPAVEAAPATQK